jgi:hypothetical protein
MSALKGGQAFGTREQVFKTGGQGFGTATGERGEVSMDDRRKRTGAAARPALRVSNVLRGAIVLAVATVGLLMLSGAPALAVRTHQVVGSFNGSDAPDGPFELVFGDAVDNSAGPGSHDVYVAELRDEGNEYVGAVDKFDEQGVYAGVRITGASTPAGSFSFLSDATFRNSGIAVDSSASANRGDVYVADIAHGVVDKFDENGNYVCQITAAATPSLSECNGVAGSATPAGSMEPRGLAVDASGDLYVADGAHAVIDKFGPAGEYIGQIADPNITEPGEIALDAGGDLYVDNGTLFGGAGVARFDSKGVFSEELDSNQPTSVAVDQGDGHVFVGEAAEPGEIAEFTASGGALDRFGHGGLAAAVDDATHRLYANQTFAGDVTIYGPDVVLPNVSTGAATDVAETSATLSGEVEPDLADGGGDVTSCAIEYGTSTSYGQTVPCSPQAPYAVATAVSATVALSPDTEYHLRVVASDSEGSNSGEDKTITTPGPATIADEAALPVTTTANLSATVDPYGSETTCKVEYVGEASFASSGYADAVSVPCSPGDVGSDFAAHEVGAHLGGLQMDSKYHYRFTAMNESSTGTTHGPDQEFVTFGIKSFSFESVDASEKPYTQAGGHPYQWNVRYEINTGVDSSGHTLPDANFKNVITELPVGFVGNATATPQCTAQDMNFDECSPAAQVGTLTVYTRGGESHEDPVFNMVPPPGVPAQLAVNIAGFVNTYIDVNVRTGGDYGLISVVHNAPSAEPVRAIWLKLWGVPAEKGHDPERVCPSDWRSKNQLPQYSFGCSDAAVPLPFLINPSACTGQPQTARLSLDAWNEPDVYVHKSVEVPPTTGCEHMSFYPHLTVQPETKVADSPSGLWVDLTVPQNTAPEGLNSSTLRKAVVALPAGVSVSPSAADGLQACSPEEIGLDNAEPARCPDKAKIGTIEIVSPMVPYTLTGTAFVAEQTNNPFGSLLAIYVVAQAHGALVKLAGHVELNPVNGQLVTTFEDTPQLPFSEFKLYFFGGPRGPLAMPVKCGTYTTTSELTPWSAPESGLDALPSDFFTIDEGCSGGFNPKFVSGVTDPQAGQYSNFALSFERSDGEGEPVGLSMSMPPGLLANLSRVPLCNEADANTGACPAPSQIGTVEAGTGPGSNPLFLPGEVYLTGPYKGGPYGLAVVVPAQAGPFDLGDVVVRQSLQIDREDAHVHIVSDPFPTIFDGIPLRMRRVDVNIDRPDFIVNPTNCEPMQITGTLTSTEGAAANVASRFQLTNCSALGFNPQLSAATSAHTSRSEGASLHVTLTYPANSVGKQANIRTVKVELPKALPSRLSTLQKACPDTVFDQNPAACPPESRIGTATASTPLMSEVLSGPAYFVSHGNAKFPELIIVLSGDNITVYLHGETFISKQGITSSTFHDLPDVPIGQFQLTLPQGPYSALTANTDLCSASLAMPTTYEAQNGASIHESTPIEVEGCPNSLLVRSHKVHSHTLALEVVVPGAGKLTANAKGLRGRSAASSRHSMLTLKLPESKAGRLRTKVQITFTPNTGKQRRILRKSITVTFP